MILLYLIVSFGCAYLWTYLISGLIGSNPDKEVETFSTIMAVVLGLLWPLTLIIALFTIILKTIRRREDGKRTS